MSIKILFALLLVAFVFPSLAQEVDSIKPNGYNKLYYKSGALSSEGTMRDGKPDGYWKTYYESGQLKSEGNRKEFQLDSIWKFYNEEGVLLKEISYANDKKNGLTTTFSTEGFVKARENFVNNLKEGWSYYYHEGDGERVHFKTPFEGGGEKGVGYEYAKKDGRIISIITYKAGITLRKEKINRYNKEGKKQGKWVTFHDDEGTVWEECEYRNDLKHGYCREFSPKGLLIATTKYDNGVVVEDAEELMNLELKSTYYPDGTVKSIGAFRDGVEEGVYREYSKEGEITASKLYKNGRLLGEGILDEQGIKQGYWKEYYYPEGDLKAEGEYLDGLKIREWVYYYPDGQIEQKGSYGKNEVVTGTWRWYYNSGQLLREENFRRGREDGMLIEYSDSGKVITEGEYVDGLEEGEWYYEVGDHIEKGNYTDGQKYGVWEHYYTSTGKLRFKGEYIDGYPEGKHVYYYDNGQRKLEGKYVSGLKEGDWKRYNRDGSIMVTIRYRDGKEKKVDGFKIKPELEDIE